MPPSKAAVVPFSNIASQILLIRNQRVIIDADLAALYGVTTKRLNEQVKRNQDRFPQDFMFQLSSEEKAQVVAVCDHLGNLKYSRTNPYAFTEHGAIMAASVLNTPRAIEASVLVVRTFVKLQPLPMQDESESMPYFQGKVSLKMLILFMKCGLRRKPRHMFPCRYTREDILLLAKVDEWHQKLSGPATKKICERAFYVYREKAFENIAKISVSHLYNLRKTYLYEQERRYFTKTKKSTVAIGICRKPKLDGQAGFIRIDTVHQGDERVPARIM